MLHGVAWDMEWMRSIQLFRPFSSSTVDDRISRWTTTSAPQRSFLRPLAAVHLRLSSRCLPFRVRSLWGQSLAFALDKQCWITINVERQHLRRLRFLHQLNRVPNSFPVIWAHIGSIWVRMQIKLSEESDTAMYTGRARVWDGSWKIRQGHNYA
jgi:hypothetical protein